MNNSKKPLLLAGTLLSAVLVAANLVVANLMIKSLNRRYDLTEDKRFEIGQGTTNILTRLDGQVTVKCYFSNNLPQRYAHVQRLVVEKLQEYEADARGKLVYEFLDPTADTEQGRLALQDCSDLGIQAVKIPENKNVLQIDRIQECYLALVFFFADRKSVFQLMELGTERVEDSAKLASDLEYVITAGIQRASTKRKTIGIVGDVQQIPANQFDPRSEKVKTLGISRLQQALERNYDVVLIDIKDLNKDGQIPGEIRTVLVYRPQGFAPPAIYKLDQFLMFGGNAFFLVDPGTVDSSPKQKQVMMGNTPVADFDLPSYSGQVIDSGLHEFLEHLGVRVERSFVLDRSAISMPYIKDRQLRQNLMRQVVAEPVYDEKVYPVAIAVPARGTDGSLSDVNQLNQERAMVARLSNLVFYMAAPLSIVPENLQRHNDRSSETNVEARAEILISSSSESWTAPIEGGVFSQAKGLDEAPSSFVRSPLMVMTTGRWRSFFQGKDIPMPEPAAEGEKVAPTEEMLKSRLNEASERSTLIVLGDADFLYDSLGNYFAQLEWAKSKNEDRAMAKIRASHALVAQAVDVLAYGGEASDLIDLRNRRLRSRDIAVMESSDPRRIRNDWLNFAVVPAGILLLGLLRFVFRWSTTGDTTQMGAKGGV